MEAITERGRRELYEKAEASWGKRTADVLMALLPPVGWAEVATAAGVKDAIDACEQRLRGEITEVRGEITEVRGEIAEVRGEIAEVRGEIAELRGEMKVENARLLRTMVVVNITTATALCVLTFQIAQASAG